MSSAFNSIERIPKEAEFTCIKVEVEDAFNSIERIRVRNFIRLYLNHVEFLSIPLNGFQKVVDFARMLVKGKLSIPLNGFPIKYCSTWAS